MDPLSFPEMERKNYQQSFKPQLPRPPVSSSIFFREAFPSNTDDLILLYYEVKAFFLPLRVVSRI